MEISFDNWYTANTQEAGIQAILEKRGLLNVMSSKTAAMLTNDPAEMAVIESLGILNCSDWYGDVFSEGMLDTLRRAAERGGDILKNILRRILKPIINKLPAAFASIAGAWAKIKPYAEKLSEMLSTAQKKKLRSMLRMVDKRPVLSVECLASAFPLLEEVKNEAGSVKVLGARARMPDLERKDARLQETAKEIITNNGAMMAIAGIGGVLFGAAFGGMAVGAVSILVLIVIAYYVFKWLTAYAKKDPELKQSLDRVNASELKRVSDEAKAIIEREVQQAEQNTIAINTSGFITLQDGAPIFNDDKSLNTKDTGDVFEYHGKTKIVKIQQDGREEFKAALGDKHDDKQIIEFQIELHGRQIFVPITDDFDKSFTKLLKDAKKVAEKKPAPNNPLITAANGAVEALRDRDLGKYRAQMITANDYAVENSSTSMQKALDIAKKIADSPTAGMKELGLAEQDLSGPYFLSTAEDLKADDDVKGAAEVADLEHSKLLKERFSPKGRAHQEAEDSIEVWMNKGAKP